MFFLKRTLVQSWKIANKRTRKAPLITDLRNMRQCANQLTVQSYQININTTNC